MHEIKILFEKSKSILGEKRAKTLWLAYTAETDLNKRREIEGYLYGLLAKRLDETFQKKKIILEPPSETVSGPYKLSEGNLLADLEPQWRSTGWLKRESSKFGIVKIPYKFMKDAKKYNVLDYVKKLKKPLLVILGHQDINVFPSSTKRVYEEANQLKELFEVDKMDHYYKNHPELIKLVNEKVISFLKSGLGSRD